MLLVPMLLLGTTEIYRERRGILCDIRLLNVIDVVFHALPKKLPSPPTSTPQSSG